MEKEKDTRKLMRVYIKPETEPDILEWAENQQNVGIAIKALIRMAIAVQGTRDILAMPFGMNALIADGSIGGREAAYPKEEAVKADPSREAVFQLKEKKTDSGGLEDIRSAYYDDKQADDMDMFGNL